MKYYIIAGEASGDLHGSNLVQQLAMADTQASFKGIGGEKMKAANVELLFGLERLAFMGFYEVLKNLRTIRRNFKQIKQDIVSFQPTVIILIDYPGFNLRMAKWCKKQGFKVVYYISPKFWAWNESRVEKIKQYVDLMLCILPFEKAFYDKHQYANAHYVGHPLLDEISIPTSETQRADTTKSIALLPGSRKQEINTLLPVMLETARNFPEEQFIITGISGLRALYPDSFPENVTLVFDSTYKVLKMAKAAIVCSGTATLETALFNVPQVVIYKTSWLNYQLGKRLIKVPFISLPNLIADEKIAEELIQYDCTSEKITKELEKLMQDSKQEFYNRLFQKMGTKGASQKAATLILELAG